MVELSDVARRLIKLRLQMMVVNEKYKAAEYKIPIHLAFGHEAIAVAVDLSMTAEDQLICSHRNIHYNLVRESNLGPVMDEYFLRENGIGRGCLGSMNLANPTKKLVYSSSILGNNLPVATGLALANDLRDSSAVTFAISGDGAMEEGAFYESLVFLSSQNLRGVVVIENNDWSLGTRVKERRRPIDVKLLSRSVGVDYMRLSGNDCVTYTTTLRDVVAGVRQRCRPAIIEVDVSTLGEWILKNDEHPAGKVINYHAGPAPTVVLTGSPVIANTIADPVYVLEKQLGCNAIEEIASEMAENLG